MKIGIIGAGAMGAGIAQAFAVTDGYEVALCDINEEIAADGKKRIGINLGRLINKGKVTRNSAGEVMARIQTGVKENLCNDCDLNYRTSKNKRLLVELTLIQLAQITSGEEEAISGGRSPKQVIKPIFNAQATTQVAQPDRQPSVSKPQQAQPAPKPAPAQPAQPPQSMAATLLAQEKKEEKTEKKKEAQ